MEEERKGIKISFSTFIVIIINFIAIICMLIVIEKSFIQEKCTNYKTGAMELAEYIPETFNSKFYIYKGIITGSKVKQLIQTVNLNNKNNTEERYVKIEGVGISENNEGEFLTSVGNVKKYKIQIIKEDGFVKNIIVYNENDEIEEYEINNTTAKENNNNSNIQEDGFYINFKLGMMAVILHLPILFIYFFVFIYYISKKKKIEKDYKEIKKLNNNIKNIYILLSIIFILWSSAVYLIIKYGYGQDTTMPSIDKPIIYIYPEEKTDITVELGRKENLTCTYPVYKDKWVVTAEPDGTLLDNETGRKYYALYWESKNPKKYNSKLEEGFIFKGEDTVKFLEEKLEILGLNEREVEEFIVYWLPQMQDNNYNYIRFQTMEEINENMPLDITPKPETIIRVMMEWKGLNKNIKVKEQKLEKVERKGYTVVEWGGTEIK